MRFGRSLFAVTSIAMAALIISLIPLQPASATGDPVIAAAGDIACDPIDSGFHGGEGTPSRCHEMYTGAELVGGAFTAVLPLGDEQYGCGGAAAFEQSYDPAWGVEAVKSTLRVLFQKFSIEDVAQNDKRVRLVERAYQTGVLSDV